MKSRSATAFAITAVVACCAGITGAVRQTQAPQPAASAAQSLMGDVAPKLADLTDRSAFRRRVGTTAAFETGS